MKHLLQSAAALLIISPILWGAQAEFYVSPTGSDKNPGTKAKPFQTITHARDAVAKINGEMSGDIMVHLGGGLYPLSAPIVFGAKDSGTKGHSIIYQAVAGETPIVSGGQAITGWSIHDKEKNIYKASVGDLEFRQIHVNGERGVRARYPNRTSKIHLGGYLGGASVTGKKPYQFKVNPKELSPWKNLNEVEVVMVTHWKQKRARIASVKGGVISFQAPENTARAMHHMEQGGTPHFYENAYEFLDAEGEFYLNTKTDTLYYKPRSGEDLSSAEVIAPKVETLLNIKGNSDAERVEHLAFEGITFQYSQWIEPNQKGFTTMQSATAYSGTAAHFNFNEIVPGAIQLRHARAVEIRSCTVEMTSAHAILATKDVVSDCTFVGNYIRDAAAGGIYLLLSKGQSTGNKIVDNTVEKIGIVYSNACGILVTCTPDVAILHNEIRDVRYTGISAGWSWNDKDTAARNQDIGYNLIHRTMGLHDDGGGIYTLGKIEGMKIHHNYIHDIFRSRYSGNYGICGIYLDNGSCHKQVHDNVIANVEAAFFSGNKPNYKNVFERNFHNVQLAKTIEKANTVRDNIKVQGSDWPKEAREIMQKAGPRGVHRRPSYIWTKGKIGGATPFNGKDEFVESGHSPKLEPAELTLQAWIRMAELPVGRDNRRWIVNKNGNEATAGHYALFIAGDKVGAYLNIGGGGKSLTGIGSGPGAIKLKQWHHLAMTYDGKTMVLCLDGKEVAKKAVNRPRQGGSGALAIGRRQDGYKSTYFNGLIDDVRLYDRAMSVAELKAQAESPKAIQDAASEKGLVGHWPL